MKSATLTCLAIISGALSASAQTQDFNCSKSGSFSECQLPDGSEIHCYDPGAGPNCTLTRPDGTAAPSVGALPVMMSIIERIHQRHLIGKAEANARSSLEMWIKMSLLYEDNYASSQALLSITPQGPTRQQAEQELARKPEFDRNAKTILANLSNTLGEDNLGFLAFPKDIQRQHDDIVLRACGTWMMFQRVLETAGQIQAQYPNHWPASVKSAFSAMAEDESHLDKDCTTKAAVKLIRKEAKKCQAGTSQSSFCSEFLQQVGKS